LVASGSLARLFELMTADPQFGEVRRVLVDSTHVRAHRHAAGAARETKHLGAAESARRPGLGRSRGGLTSKIVVTAAGESTAIAVDVRPGQAHDAPLLKPMLQRTAARVERLFAKLKEFRRVATRYEKLKQTFLGMIHLALGFIRLRAQVNVNTAETSAVGYASGSISFRFDARNWRGFLAREGRPMHATLHARVLAHDRQSLGFQARAMSAYIKHRG
jgi:transposase